MPDDPNIEDGADLLARRTEVGLACINLPDGASDAISNILTAVFGHAGAWRPTKMEDHVVTESYLDLNESATSGAKALLDRSLHSWIGDAEDYTLKPTDDLTW